MYIGPNFWINQSYNLVRFMQVLPYNTVKVSEGKNIENFNREYLIYIIGYNLHISISYKGNMEIIHK